MTENTGESLKTNGGSKKESAPEKSIFQEIWGGFKEGMKKLWGHVDEKLEPVNKKAGEISEKTKTESLKDYFKRQIEGLKNGMRARSQDVYAGLYDIGAAVSQAKVAFWHNFMGGKFVTYLGENQRNVKTRKEKVKEYREKAKNIRESLKKSKVSHE